jgi:replicative DNA helicase
MFEAFSQAYGGGRPATDLSALVFGKVQPQALDFEEAVLGALMLDKDAFLAVCEVLRAESFYLESHQLIYASINRLFDLSRPVDLLTVTEELRRMNAIETIGGAYYLVELTNRVASAANIEYHARIIAQKKVQRDVIRISTEQLRDAYEDSCDVFDLVERGQLALLKTTQFDTPNSANFNDLAVSTLAKIVERKEGAHGGIRSPHSEINKIIPFFGEGDLVIIAARPSMGKTFFALDLAKNAASELAEKGKKVALFSLEMSSEALATRLMSALTGINSNVIATNAMDLEELGRVESAIKANLPIIFDDTAAVSCSHIRRALVKAKGSVGMVVVDYLQLMRGEGRNREQEIASISRGLKAVAKDFKVPVIALSQLSRAVETRGGSKVPQLSDLRESGSIEQDADIVCFLYRPEYYEITEDGDGNSTKGLLSFVVAKNRNGALGTARMFAELATNQLRDWSTTPNIVYASPPPQRIEDNIITRPANIKEGDANLPF